MPIPQFAPRQSIEPVVDLTTHAVVHRAIRVDIARLATTVRALTDGQLSCTATRAEALRDYLSGMGHQIRCHERVEKSIVLSLLMAMSADDSSLLPRLSSDGDSIGSLLDRAEELIAGLALLPHHGLHDSLAETLDPLAERLERHLADEERIVFPLIRDHLTEESFCWVEGQFECGLKPQLLPFIVPWVVSHATAGETALMAAHAKTPLRAILKTFNAGFVERQQAAFA